MQQYLVHRFLNEVFELWLDRYLNLFMILYMHDAFEQVDLYTPIKHCLGIL